MTGHSVHQPSCNARREHPLSFCCPKRNLRSREGIISTECLSLRDFKQENQNDPWKIPPDGALSRRKRKLCRLAFDWLIGRNARKWNNLIYEQWKLYELLKHSFQGRNAYNLETELASLIRGCSKKNKHKRTRAQCDKRHSCFSFDHSDRLGEIGDKVSGAMWSF